MHVVIIGNGISGVTCARYIRKNSDANITIISGESLDFFSRPALMYLYMGCMKFENILPYPPEFWKKNRINRLKDWVSDIDVNQKKVTLKSGEYLSWDKLVIATGSIPARLQVPGEDLHGVQGFYHLDDLRKLETITPNIEKALVIGGGLIGVELAEMLTYREKEVHFIIREKSYFDHTLPKIESELLHKHILSKGVKIHTETTITEFKGDTQNRLTKARSANGNEFTTGFAGVCIGVKPNIEWLKHLPLYHPEGIQVSSFFETKLKDIYAIGDCAYMSNPPSGHKARETMWYTGKLQGMQAASSILEKPTPYQVPVWFNSAKFFDIEYQVYGHVPVNIDKNMECDSEIWKDPKGDRMIRLVWNKEDKNIIGMHGLGIRLRQELISSWISSKKTKDQVLPNLKEAIFDSEFSKKIL